MDDTQIETRQGVLFVHNVFRHKYNMLDVRDTFGWK